MITRHIPLNHPSLKRRVFVSPLKYLDAIARRFWHWDTCFQCGGFSATDTITCPKCGKLGLINRQLPRDFVLIDDEE